MISDMVLLLIVFAGLFVIRHGGGGTIGLTRLVWEQVRWRLLDRSSFDSQLLLFYFFRKGVIWLVLGSAAEIPPLVSPGSL
jgi:hypothetical protein